jgi:CHASE2 domain-containing sensor protein
MVESRADHNEISCVHATSKSHACTALRDRIAVVSEPETKMEFTALFLATTITMLVAWRSSRPLALGLFTAVLLASLATYLHHATDTLKLSF